jgi:hypothetical protein
VEISQNFVAFSEYVYELYWKVPIFYTEFQEFD